MNATEPGVTRSANFVASNSVACEEFAQQARGRAVHGICDEAEVRLAEALPIDKFLNRIQVRGPRLERLNETLARWQGRESGRHDDGKLAFNLRNNGRQSAATVTCFVLKAIPAGRVVACGDNDSAGGVALPYQQRNRGRWTGLIGQPDGRARRADDFSDFGSYAIGLGAVIVADEDALACVFSADHVTSNGVSDDASVLRGEIFTNH